jgi:hypothetical protein
MLNTASNADDAILTVIGADNSVRDHRLKFKKSTGELYGEINIWGGLIFNGGESDVSSVVYCSRNSLESFTYFPTRTKGGAMVRPLYYQGDRQGKCEFPNLKSLSMPLHAMEFSQSLVAFGWITPSLKKLTLLKPDQSGDPEDSKQPEYYSLLLLTLGQQLQRENPTLETITIAEANFDSPESKRTIVSLKMPTQLSRDKTTLMLLALAKENPNMCGLAGLSTDLIKCIYNMLSCSFQVVYPPPMKAHGGAVANVCLHIDSLI